MSRACPRDAKARAKVVWEGGLAGTAYMGMDCWSQSVLHFTALILIC